MAGYPRWHTASEQGPRARNADAVSAYAAAGARGITFALADGVGDDPGAGRAAQVAAAAAARTPLSAGPVRAILAAQEALQRLGGTGDAVLVVAMPFEGGYQIAWVGDARAYAWDGSMIHKLTQDHTMAEYFRSRHQPYSPRMEHLVTTSVRTARPEEIGTTSTTSGGLLLTSDGVHKVLPPATIDSILADPARGASALVATAIALGGRDNATALFVEAPPTVVPEPGSESASLVTERFPTAA
ncbi:PP2C family protein-serine/threonine phosphatase [Amycolatopsis benzoatilytica]|uniref:PP2C family protein-serine/threonine phosphatase n=1 Tax=Amycolatopsis benzoatilytica TaxID=346045 RepID=UPI000363B2BF|nr:serine/threonine protein phosphatase [Amycolatopsis benzoatilytica]